MYQSVKYKPNNHSLRFLPVIVLLGTEDLCVQREEAQLTAKFSGTLLTFVPPFMNLLGSMLFARAKA